VSALREETSDTRTKIEEGNEGIDASAEIDAVVDELLDWAEDDDDDCLPLPVTPEQRTPSPSRPPRSHSSRPPIPTLLPCVACADRAAELEKASMKEAELRTALDEAGLIAREYRARMHHARLDADGDGYIGLDELLRHELFASYSQAVVERVHAFFPYADRAKHGELDEDDFVKLTLWTEDRSTRDSQRFWFGVVDVDGDGVLGAHDVKWLYDSLWKEEGSCVSAEDLTCQIHDMAGVDDFHFRSTQAARGGAGRPRGPRARPGTQTFRTEATRECARAPSPGFRVGV
jgi:Ca2+-binding EF-hand superfamily protein